MKNNDDLSGISNVGLGGISLTCAKAVMSILVSGDDIQKATILTSNNAHCFLLQIGEDDLVAVKSGFSSGYKGEGPSALELVLRLFDQRRIPIREVLVDADMIRRLDASALKSSDIEFVANDKNARRRAKWLDYVEREGASYPNNLGIWRSFLDVISYSQIDHRIHDRALHFPFEPDIALLKGYRRLEGLIKKRTGLNEIGSKLFAQAFQGDTAKLTWASLNQAEINGRGSLFTAEHMALRNPRAHNEISCSKQRNYSERMLLNTLFQVEAEATGKLKTTEKLYSCEKY
jgi:Protein of unknown function (Hypoth_ymh)